MASLACGGPRVLFAASKSKAAALACESQKEEAAQGEHKMGLSPLPSALQTSVKIYLVAVYMCLLQPHQGPDIDYTHLLQDTGKK